MTAATINYTIYLVSEIIIWIILIRAVMGWFTPGNRLTDALDALLEPIMTPFRALLSKIGGGNPMFEGFAPLLALIAIQWIIVPLLQTLVSNLII